MNNQIADADTADTLDHNNLDLSKYEYIYQDNLTNFCEDPYICCCSFFCPLLSLRELIRYTKPKGICCANPLGACLLTIFNFPPYCALCAPLCPEQLVPCILTQMIDYLFGIPIVYT